MFSKLIEKIRVEKALKFLDYENRKNREREIELEWDKKVMEVKEKAIEKCKELQIELLDDTRSMYVVYFSDKSRLNEEIARLRAVHEHWEEVIKADKQYDLLLAEKDKQIKYMQEIINNMLKNTQPVNINNSNLGRA